MVRGVTPWPNLVSNPTTSDRRQSAAHPTLVGNVQKFDSMHACTVLSDLSESPMGQPIINKY